MNKLFASICLLISLSAAPVCLAQTSTPSKSKVDISVWEEFTLPNGQFVVSMPAKPESQSIPFNLNANTLVAHFLGLDKDSESYSVTYVEFPTRVDDSAMSKAILDAISDKELTKVLGRLIGQTDIEINGYPGREIRIEVADGFWVNRLYLVGRRMYIISAFAAKTSTASKVITEPQNAVFRKYFESFKLKLEPR